MSRAARRAPRTPRKRNAFTQSPLFGEAAPAPSRGRPAHPKGEDPAIPHAKRFADGYRVWNPMIRAYVGDANMQPFRDVGHASDMVRTLYVEMADAGKGSRRVVAKAKTMREQGDLLSGPVAPRPTGEQTGFKFNGQVRGKGRREPVYESMLASLSMRQLESLLAATDEDDVARHTAIHRAIRDRAAGVDHVDETRRRVRSIRNRAEFTNLLRRGLLAPPDGSRARPITKSEAEEIKAIEADHDRQTEVIDAMTDANEWGASVELRRHRAELANAANAARDGRINDLYHGRKRNPYAIVDNRGRRAIPDTFDSRTEAGLARRYIEASQGGGGLRVRPTSAVETARHAAKRNGEVGRDYVDLFDVMRARKTYLRQHLGAALKRIPGVSRVERQDKTSGAVQYKLAMPGGTAYVVLQSRFDAHGPAGPYADVEVTAGRIGGDGATYKIPSGFSHAEALRAAVAHAAQVLGGTKQNDGRHEHGHGRRSPPPDSFAIGRPVYADEARGPRSQRQRDEDWEAISMLKPNGRQRAGAARVSTSDDGAMTLEWTRDGHAIRFEHDLFSGENEGEDTTFYVDGERVGSGIGPQKFGARKYGFGDYSADDASDPRFALVEPLFAEAARLAIAERATRNSGEGARGANPLAVAAADVRAIAELAGPQAGRDLLDAADLMLGDASGLRDVLSVLRSYANASTDADVKRRLAAAADAVSRVVYGGRKSNGRTSHAMPRGTLVLVEVVGSHPVWPDARLVQFTAVPPYYGKGRAPRHLINSLIAGAIGASVQRSPDAVVLRDVAAVDSGGQAGTRAVEELAKRMHGDPKAFRAQTSYAAKRNGAARSRRAVYLQPTVERIGGELRFVSRHTPREWQALAIASGTDLPVSQFADAWVGQGVDLPEASAAIASGVTNPREARRMRSAGRR